MFHQPIARLITAAALVVCTTLAAEAQSEAEKIFDHWIAEARNFGASEAAYDKLEYDPGSGRLTATNTRVRIPVAFSLGPLIQVRLDISFHSSEITIDNLREQADGYLLDAISYGQGTQLSAKLDAGQTIDVKITLDGYSARDLFQPRLVLPADDPDRPISRYYAFLRAAAAYEAGAINIDRITIDQAQSTGETGRTIYNDLTLTDMRAGRVGSYTIASGSSQSTVKPAGDQTMRMSSTFGRQVFTGLDIGRLVSVLDPNSYVTGKTDPKFYSILESASLTDLSIKIDGISNISIATMEFSGASVQQPKLSLFGLFDKLASGDAPADSEIMPHLFAIFSLYNFDRFGIDDLRIDSTGPGRGAMKHLRLLKVGAGRIGQLLVEGLAAEADGQGTLRLDSLSIEDVRLPSADAILSVIAAEQARREPSVKEILAVTPTIGGLSIRDFQVSGQGLSGSLNAYDLVMRSFIGPIPTDLLSRLKELRLPIGLIGEREAREFFTKLGYSSLTVSEDLTLHWDSAAETLALRGARLLLESGGELTVNAVFGGVPRSVFENPQTAQMAIGFLTVNSIDVEYVDASMVDRILQAQATDLKISKEQFRDQMIASIPALIAMIQNPDFQRRVETELAKFLRTPGRLRLSAKPPKPVPVTQLLGAAATAPQTIPDLLAIEVWASN